MPRLNYKVVLRGSRYAESLLLTSCFSPPGIPPPQQMEAKDEIFEECVLKVDHHFYAFFFFIDLFLGHDQSCRTEIRIACQLSWVQICSELQSVGWSLPAPPPSTAIEFHCRLQSTRHFQSLLMSWAVQVHMGMFIKTKTLSGTNCPPIFSNIFCFLSLWLNNDGKTNDAITL